MPANDTLLVKKITEPIGSPKSTDKSSYQKPAWAEAASASITRKEPTVLILQWIRDRVVRLTTRVPFNKVRGIPNHRFGFTCKECIHRGWRGPHQRHWPWASLTTPDGEMVKDGGVRVQHMPVRCKKCNTKHTRYKRARRGMEKITRDLKARPGLKCWFITLTKPNIIFQAGETIDTEADKADWIASFKKLRRRKAWKETFAGGYWFYEYTLHQPGDKIFDKKGNFVRACKDFELNGHLHVLATAESRIPMKELAADWDGRADFRRRDRKTNRPIDEQTILRYLRGYLTKSASSGVCMRPFGDIHNG